MQQIIILFDLRPQFQHSPFDSSFPSHCNVDTEDSLSITAINYIVCLQHSEQKFKRSTPSQQLLSSGHIRGQVSLA